MEKEQQLNWVAPILIIEEIENTENLVGFFINS